MSVLEHRTRGFRTINIVFCGLLMVTAILVLLAKAYAGREVREIARTERAIAEQNKRIRLLKAEVAHLEQPERLQRLAKDLLGMGPLAAAREGDISSLDALVAGQTPAPPVATPAAPETPAQEDIGVAAAPLEAPIVATVTTDPAETGQ